MKILAIESTCDETAAAIVEDGQRVHCNVIYSQIAEHNKTGGVVPEVAARRHAEAIVPVVDEAFKVSGFSVDDIDAIAVSQGPGLMGCLMVGNNAASALSLIWNKPLIPVHHIEGHLYSGWLSDDLSAPIIPFDPERDARERFPILFLTVSGGHNNLVLMEDHGRYRLLGESLDDAAGEAFDKVARMLGLGYPGGPEIQKIAAEGNEANGFVPGDPQKYELPRAMMKNQHAATYNFSFSGLKTAVKELIKKVKADSTNVGGDPASFEATDDSPAFEAAIPDIAASFEYTICDTLLIKLKKASEAFAPKEIQIVGGVSANLRLRKMLEETFPQPSSPDHPSPGPTLNYPSLKFCTDNAAMIGSVAYFRYMTAPEKYTDWRNSIPNLKLKLYEN